MSGHRYSARVLPAGSPPDGPAAPGVIWQDPRWRRYVARTDLHDVRDLVVAEDGVPVARATLLVTARPGGLLFYDPPRLVGTPGAMAEPDLLDPAERRRWDDLTAALAAHRAEHYPTVVLATFGSHHGVAHAPGRDAGQRRAVLAALPALLEGVAAELGCRSAALLYLDGAEAAAVGDAVPGDTWTPLLLGAEGVQELSATDADGYVAGLTSRRRTRLRRETAEYRAAGFRTVVRTGPAALDDEIVALQVAHRAKYGLPGGGDRVRRDLAALAGTVGEDCVVLGAERDGRLHGFVLYLRGGAALFARTAGFLPEARGCYLTLTYHETARWAVEHGVRRVHYGLAAYEAKLARGCVLEPRWGFVTAAGPPGAVLGELAELQSLTVARRLDRVGAPVAPLPSRRSAAVLTTGAAR